MDFILAPFVALAALSLIEIAIVVILALAFVYSTASDRAGAVGQKWFVSIVALAAYVVFNYDNISLSGFWESITTLSTWTPIIVYAVMGLLYSSVEFVLHLRKEAKSAKEKWAKFLTTSCVLTRELQDGKFSKDKVLMSSLIEEGRSDLNLGNSDTSAVAVAKDKIQQFVSEMNNDCYSRSFIFYVSSTQLSVEPAINRSKLAAQVGAITMFWPAYAMSLIVGDLLKHICEVVADVFTNLSARTMKMLFRDAFKL